MGIIAGSRLRAAALNPFIIEVDTSKDGSGSDTFQFTGAVGDYDVVAKQNGTQVATFNDLSGQQTITLPSSGVYDLEIKAKGINGFNRIAFDNGGDKDKIIDIKQWGEVAWSSFERAFYGCENMLTTATDIPNLSNVTDMYYMFANTSSANPDVSNWDVSSVTAMSYMFYNASSANPEVSNWDVSSVTSMYAMFYGASSANPNTTNWDVSSVTDMSYMFYNASSANPEVSNWDVSSVTSMKHMFRNTSSANPNTTNWDVSSVTDMRLMFYNTSSANPDVSNWDVSSVTSMYAMFYGASSANPEVSNWDVSSVTSMYAMFFRASSANPDVSNWDVSNVTDMRSMFRNTSSANPEVSNWDVSNVTDMRSMFRNTSSANPDMRNWDISNVTNMSSMLENSNLSVENLTLIYENWSQLTLQQNVSFSAGNTKYNSSGQSGRDVLTNTYNWTITDGGQVYQPFIIEVDTTKAGSASNQFQFTGALGDYDVVAKQNDIVVATFDNLSGEQTITLPSSGVYDLEVSAKEVNGFNRIQFNNEGDRLKITDIKQWGEVAWSSFSSAFNGCENMLVTATDIPNLSSVTNMSLMFRSATSANPDTTNWNVGSVTDMGSMFRNTSSANPDVSNWDVSNVTDINRMFFDASLANPNTSNWNVSNVTNMSLMFRSATSANPDVSNWDVSNVTNMRQMFFTASSANPDVSNWDVSSVTNMKRMFQNSNLSVENLTACYENWSQLNLQQNVSFSAGNTKYNASGQAGRDILVNTYNWTIEDGGQV
jgi:surface protein